MTRRARGTKHRRIPAATEPPGPQTPPTKAAPTKAAPTKAAAPDGSPSRGRASRALPWWQRAVAVAVAAALLEGGLALAVLLGAHPPAYGCTVSSAGHSTPASITTAPATAVPTMGTTAGSSGARRWLGDAGRCPRGSYGVRWIADTTLTHSVQTRDALTQDVLSRQVLAEDALTADQPGQGEGDPSQQILGIVARAQKWLMWLLSGVVGLIFVIAGVRYAFAGGRVEEIEAAKRSVKSAATGYLLVVLADAFVSLLRFVAGG